MRTYSIINKSPVFIAMIICVSAIFQPILHAQSSLSNWPWRGVSIQNDKADYHDVDSLRTANVNCIRIFMKIPQRAKREKISFNKAFMKELDWAEQIIDECKKNKITCVLAFNFLQFDLSVEISDKSDRFWAESKYFDSTFKYVEIFANRFKNKGDELSAYEVISEPVITSKSGGKLPSNLADFFKGIISSIRKYDSKRYFLLTPGPWGKPTNYKNWKGFGIREDKIIYNAHMYIPDIYTHQGVHGRAKGVSYPGYINGVYWDKDQIRKAFSSLKQFQKNYKAYVYIGEFSVARWSMGKDQWLKDVIDVMEANGFSWTYFSYKAELEAWDPFFDVTDPKVEHADLKVEYKGDQTSTWQLLKSYFYKNKFTMK